MDQAPARVWAEPAWRERNPYSPELRYRQTTDKPRTKEDYEYA